MGWVSGPSATEGDDVYEGDGSDDAAFGLGGSDILRGYAGEDNLQGGEGVDYLYGGEGTDSLNGDAGDDFLWGGAARDWLSDSAGNDTLYGEGGDDVFVLQGGYDGGVNVLDGGADWDIVSWYWDPTVTDITVSLSGGIQTIGTGAYEFISIEVLEGSHGDDTLTGSDGSDNLWGAQGDDHLYGLGGEDYFNGDEPSDSVDVGADIIDGGDDWDAMIYPSAFAAFSFSFSADLSELIVSGPQGTDTLRNIEGVWFTDTNADVVLGTSGADTLGGHAGPDITGGGAGDDNFIGGSGRDWLIGGAGVDTVDYSGSASAVTIDLLVGSNSGGDAEGDRLTSIEGLIGSALADHLSGDANDNALRGGGGDDSLDGRGGLDTAIFEGDRSEFEFTNVGPDVIVTNTETGEAQTLTNIEMLAFADVSVVLNSGAGDLGGFSPDVLLDTDSVTATYSAIDSDNWTIGDDDAELHDAAELEQSLIDDGVPVDEAKAFTAGSLVGDAIIAAAILAGAVALSLSAAEILALNAALTLPAVIGDIKHAYGTYVQLLKRYENDPSIDIDAEQDAIIAKLKDDLAADGVGPVIGPLLKLIRAHVHNSELSVSGAIALGADAAPTVFENGHHDTFIGSDFVDWVTLGSGGGVLYGAGGDDRLSGSSANDYLVGGAGSDVLNGGTGGDVMNGGAGGDIYVVDNTSDEIAEKAAGGVDLVQSSISHTLGANLENLTLIGSGAVNGVGNKLANVITGNSKSNVLTGLAGADTLSGGAGGDKLVGGAGIDTLVGGSGADMFVLNAAAKAANADTIADFVHRMDKIQLENSVFTALGATGKLAATNFWIGAGAHDANDRIIYDDTTGKLYYDANGSAVGKKVLIANLDVHLGLTASDFQVI